jgi:hypothetical protein
MAITYNDDHEVFVNGERIMWPRDGNHSPSAVLAGFDINDVLTFGRFTPDGKLKVDASVTIETVDIGDVGLFVRDSLGVNHLAGGVLNPDLLTWALYTQDKRMTFTGGDLNVKASITLPPGLATENTLLNVFDATRGLSPIQTTISRDVNGYVSTIVETDGLITKTSTLTRSPDGSVTSIAEVTV